MNNILVPTDFSIKANNALTLAKVIAKKTGGKITLLHVMEIPGHTHTSLGEEVNSDHMNEVYVIKLLEKSEKELQLLKDANQDSSYDLSVEIKAGEPFKEINEFIALHKIDLVIAGDKGHSSIENIFIGSLSDKLVRTLSCPIITTKAIVNDITVKNIVYVVNGKGDEEPILKYLKTLNSFFSATIHLVWINTPSDFMNDVETKAWLNSIAAEYKLENFTINVHSNRDEEFGVVHFADEMKADLIVLGITNRTVIQRLISGDSLAEEVSDHSLRPVMTMKLND